MPSVQEKLTDLFKEFEVALTKEKETEHAAWAERAFLCIMGEESPLDREASVYHYADVDKSKYRG